MTAGQEGRLISPQQAKSTNLLQDLCGTLLGKRKSSFVLRKVILAPVVSNKSNPKFS